MSRATGSCANPSTPGARRGGLIRRATRLAIDLEALDRATAPHERTARLLAAATNGARPRLAARRGPQFDLRWYRGRRLYVAEVKSLNGTDETQQIRLGFGQVFDYRAQPAPQGTGTLPVERTGGYDA